MGEENKIVEVSNTTEDSNPKTEWQEKLEQMMKESYLMGLSKGGKTFIGVIYEIIADDRKKRMNPANTVMRIEATCKKLLGMKDYEPNQTNESDEVN